MSDIWKALGMSIVCAFAVLGFLSFIQIARNDREIEQLKKQIENQTMLIEILNRSCECECEFE